MVVLFGVFAAAPARVGRAEEPPAPTEAADTGEAVEPQPDAPGDAGEASDGGGAKDGEQAEDAPKTPPPGWLRFVKVPSMRPAFRLLTTGLRNLEADLLFGYEWDRQEVSDAEEPRTRFESMRFTERLFLAERGFVFDRRLVHFRLAATFGLFQEQFSTTGENRTSHGNLLGFDASAVLLESKPYTLTLLGNRSEDVLSREFAGTTRVLLENYGSTLTLRETPLRSLLAFRRQRVRQELTFGADSTTRDEIRTTASYQGNRIGETTDFDLTYEFNDVADQIDPELSFQTHDGSAFHRLFFGEFLEKSLQSRVRLFDRQGSSDTLFAQTDENLRMDHTDALATFYDYTFLFNRVSDVQTLGHAGDAGVQHRLFGSVITNLRGVGNYSTVDGGKTSGYGGNLSVDYTKRIPFEGRFSAGGRTTYRIDNQRIPSGEIFVFQEPHTVQNFQLIFLNNPRVIADTIFVTDGSGSPFLEGFDYTVTVVGQLTALQPVPGGRMQDGQVILVDYSYATAPRLDFSTLTHGFSLALDYHWFSLFFERHQSDQSLLSGDDGAFLDDVTDQAGGGQLRWTQPYVQASLLGEYRTYDSSDVAYRSPRFVESLTLFPARTVSLNATLSETFFTFTKPDDRETASVLGRLNATWRPLANLYVDSFASYLWLDDTEAPDEQLFDTGVRLQWEIGRLRVIPTAAIAHRQVGEAETTEFRVSLTLIRKLL